MYSNKMSYYHHKKYPHIFISPDPYKKGGVAIALKVTLAFSLKNLVVDLEGNYIIVSGTINNLL